MPVGHKCKPLLPGSGVTPLECIEILRVADRGGPEFERVWLENGRLSHERYGHVIGTPQACVVRYSRVEAVTPGLVVRIFPLGLATPRHRPGGNAREIILMLQSYGFNWFEICVDGSIHRSAPDQGSLSRDPKLCCGAEGKVRDKLGCSLEI